MFIPRGVFKRLLQISHSGLLSDGGPQGRHGGWHPGPPSLAVALGFSDLFQSALPPWWLRGKDLLTRQETSVQSPGREDPLEEGMAAHSSILA